MAGRVWCQAVCRTKESWHLRRCMGDLLGRCGGVDPSAALVWVIAVGTAVAAALWAGADAVAEARHAVRGLAEEEVSGDWHSSSSGA